MLENCGFEFGSPERMKPRLHRIDNPRNARLVVAVANDSRARKKPSRIRRRHRTRSPPLALAGDEDTLNQMRIESTLEELADGRLASSRRTNNTHNER
jgi:hypothetical protein